MKKYSLSRVGMRMAIDVRSKYEMYGRTKWNEIFESENEIVNALKEIPEIQYANQIPYTGYMYINSFSHQIRAGKELTAKQITQCKRLALQIRIAYEIRNEWKEVE